MIFSETLESIQRLQAMLQIKGTKSEIIYAKLKSEQHQNILSQWGKQFLVLLSVHTLEIGYDVPEVSVAIILASTSNMNQVVQRIGRVVRNYEGKEEALIYNVYLSNTGDVSTLNRLRRAADTSREEAYNKARLDSIDKIRKSYTIKSLDDYFF